MVRLLFSFGNLVGVYKTRAIQDRQKRKPPKGHHAPLEASEGHLLETPFHHILHTGQVKRGSSVNDVGFN